MLLRLFILFIALISLAKPQQGQQANAASAPVYNVIYAREAVDWSRCQRLGPLTAPWSNGRDSTTFRAFYTDQHFVFRFDVRDSEIVDLGHTEQSVTEGDRVELFFSASPSLANPYYCIEVSPKGNVLDYSAKYHRQFDDSWKLEGLKVNAQQARHGYVVEGKIPLDFFRTLISSVTLKGKNVYVGVFRAEMSQRHLPDAFTWFSWLRPESATPDFHIPSSFGTFKF